MTPLAHIAGVVAIWTMMLFGLRFAVASAHWLLPIVAAAWHMVRCEGPDRRICRRRFVAAILRLHTDLTDALTVPWSAPLLFTGSAFVGTAIACGSAGDAAILVSVHPAAWEAFDIATDCVAAVLAVTGMAFIQAATSTRRTASFLVSGALIVTGLGIGIVTL